MVFIFSLWIGAMSLKAYISVALWHTSLIRTCIATVFQTSSHLKISLVDFVHSVKQIKVAWLLELIKLCGGVKSESLSTLSAATVSNMSGHNEGHAW